MAITSLEQRQQILDELGVAIDELALAVACLGEAHEQLDTTNADRLEAGLFKPVQRAYAQARRTYSGFARRSMLEAGEFSSPSAGLASQGVKTFVERAVATGGEADRKIAELQDSMLPVEAGDSELRAGLEQTRSLLDRLGGASREFLRTLGR